MAWPTSHHEAPRSDVREARIKMQGDDGRQKKPALEEDRKTEKDKGDGSGTAERSSCVV